LQTSDATGAAQSQLGPDAQAAVVYLNKHAGLSHGKIADTFDKFFGITLTRGACAQIVLRAGQRLQPVYEQLRQHLQTATHLTPDETGWRIGGLPAWLHGWVGEDFICFQNLLKPLLVTCLLVIRMVIGCQKTVNLGYDKLLGLRADL